MNKLLTHHAAAHPAKPWCPTMPGRRPVTQVPVAHGTLRCRLTVVALACLGALAMPVSAQHIRISNANLVSTDIEAGTAQVQFDLHWDDAWRTSDAQANWNAAWVFVKYRPPDGNWTHATLSENKHDHRPHLDAEIRTAEGIGVFLYRADDGRGAATWRDNRLQWQYAADKAYASATIEVIAIETVHIPTGRFVIAAETNETATTIITADSRNPPAPSAGYRGSQGGGFPPSRPMPDNSSWPNGYNAFYVMARPVLYGDYVNFLNTINATHALARLPDFLRAEQDGAISLSKGRHTTHAPSRICAGLGLEDSTAFAVWSGLRPLTELEWEKICRGPVGRTTSHHRTDGAKQENGTTPYGVDSGASQHCCVVVSSATAAGRAYTGGHGRGRLPREGNADTELRWPPLDGWTTSCFDAGDDAVRRRESVTTPDSFNTAAGIRFARSAP